MRLLAQLLLPSLSAGADVPGSTLHRQYSGSRGSIRTVSPWRSPASTSRASRGVYLEMNRERCIGIVLERFARERYRASLAPAENTREHCPSAALPTVEEIRT